MTKPSTETKRLIIESDVSSVLAGEERMLAATERREDAVRALADVQNRHERERIDALKASEDASKRALAVRKEEIAAAKAEAAASAKALAEARAAVKAEAAERQAAVRERMQAERAAETERAAALRTEQAARRQAAQQQLEFLRAVEAAERSLHREEQARLQDLRAKQAAAAAEFDHHAQVIRAYGASESAVLRQQQKALEQRAAAERIIGNDVAARQADMQRELLVIQRIAAEEQERAQADYERRNRAFGAASDQAGGRDTGGAKQPVEQTREWKSEVDSVNKSYVGVAASIGNIVTGVQSAVALTREVVTFVDETVNESYEVQAIARNLQLDIGPARAALKGLVADKDLALAANKAVAMGVADTGEKFGEIAGMVATQATKLGKDATQLINDYVEAVGKQESEIFDNLGLTLRLTDAYEIQAKALGKSVKDLTANEKATAFQEAALISLRKATGQAAVEVEGFARSWREGRVEWENFRTSVLGFDDTAGRVNQALRTMTDEEIDRVGKLTKDIKYHGQSLVEVNDQLKAYGVTLEDLKRIADEQGLSFEAMLERAKDAHAAQAEAARRAAVESELKASVTAANEQAEALEHTAKLLEIEGGKKKDVLATEIQALEVQRDAMIVQAYLTKSAEDEAKIRKLNYQIELKNAQLNAPKKGGGGKRDTADDKLNRERDATLAVLKAREQIIKTTQYLVRDLESQALVDQRLVDIAREELDVRQRTEEARNPKRAADVAKRDAELAKIATERRVLNAKAEQNAFELERDQAQERIAQLDREIERNEALGVSVKLLQMKREQAALSYAQDFGTAEERAQAEHEFELTRIEESRALVGVAESERLAAFEREQEMAQARGEIIRGAYEERFQLEMDVANAENDADKRRAALHKRELGRIEEWKRREQAAHQAVQGVMGQLESFGSFVIQNAIKDDKKRERAQLRLSGVMAIARAAVEQVEAIASFARYDFVGGALHEAAAVTGFIQGGIMLAGNIPGSSGGAGAGAGGGAGHQTVLSDNSSSASSGTSANTKPAGVTSGEELTRIRGGYAQHSTGGSSSAGTVINISNSTIVGADTGRSITDLTDRQTRKRYGT